MMRIIALGLSCLVLVLASACSVVPPSLPAVAGLFDDTAFRPVSIDRRPEKVFELSPAMARYLREHINPAKQVRGGQWAVLDALYSGHHLKFSYDASFTRTASEAFEASAGNCLSLVILTASFAKAADVDMRYQVVDSEQVWSRSADLVQVIGHVNIALANPGALHRQVGPQSQDWMTVDFLPLGDAQGLRTREISERRVVAMYFNNKAAEALDMWHVDEAYAWVRAAIEQDPLFAAAYSTLGVLWGRQARPEMAERALHAALQIEPDNPNALSNLVGVLRDLHRDAEADATQQRLAQVERHSPVIHYKAGLRAYAAGDYRQAEQMLLEALRMAPQDHEIHFLLSSTYLRLGQRDEAAEELRAAISSSADTSRRAAYVAKLARLVPSSTRQ